MELPPFCPDPPTFKVGARIVYLEDGAVEGKSANSVFTGKELAVLLLLIYLWLSAPRAYMPASQIARYLYGHDCSYIDPHVIEVYVSNIRRKIGVDNCIICCRGKGYRLNKGVCSAPVQMVKSLLENLNPH